MNAAAGEPQAEVDNAPVVRVFGYPEEVAEAALDELASTLALQSKPLVSFASGKTFAAFFAALTRRVAAGELSLRGMVATHLDEYLAFAPDRDGGMARELLTACPPLDDLLAEGRFWPVPSSGTDADLREHEQRLLRAGGVELQFLGIGRNGHVAFNEPGNAVELGWHRTRLAETTRQDARQRFVGELPEEAVTAGLRTILSARRLVLAATGANKLSAFARGNFCRNKLFLK